MSATDRLGLTLCLAIVVHGMIIFGVGFSPETEQRNFDRIEVVLVSSNSENAPRDARLLAPSNAEGGGDSKLPERPAAPLPTPLPGTEANIVAAPQQASERVLPRQPDAGRTPDEAFISEVDNGQSELTSDSKRLLTSVETSSTTVADRRRNAAEAELSIKPDPQAPQPESPARDLPSAAQLITSSFALASINSELEQRLSAYAEQPRRKFISASTREYRYAAYMEAWRAKVERVGNLNYPEEARRRHLTGSLEMNVAIDAQGRVRDITIVRSSGHPELDTAAVRIVELAAPFAAFPPDIRKEADILEITRVWQFVDGSGFSG
ncbi:MAG: energy transducer TonB [Gammaproteobacteria bacterium]|nr:energy transducer TonB [Gammaproteobacteria bacterium]